MTNCPGLTADQAVAMVDGCLAATCGGLNACLAAACPVGSGGAGGTGIDGAAGGFRGRDVTVKHEVEQHREIHAGHNRNVRAFLGVPHGARKAGAAGQIDEQHRRPVSHRRAQPLGEVVGAAAVVRDGR